MSTGLQRRKEVHGERIRERQEAGYYWLIGCANGPRLMEEWENGAGLDARCFSLTVVLRPTQMVVRRELGWGRTS